MKDRTLQIACRSVTKAADDVRMADTVERDRFILKIFYECAFEIGVEIVLKKDIERFDDDLAVRRVSGGNRITCEKYLGITAASQFPLNVVTPVKPAVVQ